MSAPTAVRTWQQADVLLRRRLKDGTGKLIESRKIANNTYLQRRGPNRIAVKFHNTDVVTYVREPDSIDFRWGIELNSGGWLTMSTKDRMNSHIPRPCQVFSRDGRWFVTRAESLTDPTLDWDNAPAYADGMSLWRMGPLGIWYVKGEADENVVAREDAHNKRINKLITAYMRSTVVKKRLESPHYGPPEDFGPNDCPWCRRVYAFDGDGEGNAADYRILGDVLGDTQHLIEHLLDKTLPLTLVYAACANEYRVQVSSIAKRDLRKYLRDRLLVGAVATQHGRLNKHMAEQAQAAA